MAEKKLLLGIDIGTTSVKVCIVDGNTKEIIAKQQKDTQANVPSELGTEGNKQDVPKILSALHACISRLPKDLLRQVVRIGVCGQMHGVMLWQSGKSWDRIYRDENLIRFDIVREKVSALYTWQDSRCSPEFLSSLPKPQSHLSIFTGYGCATLFWMAKNNPTKLEKYDSVGTIQDFAVNILCNLDKPIMSAQNAASWGYFDCAKNEWNIDLLKEAGFPVHFLPKVIPNGAIAGQLFESWCGIPAGTPIGAALGDFQCSFFATIENNNDAVLNISTSAQLGFIAENFKPESFSVDNKSSDIGSVEYVPYFGDKFLAVGASLNGGNCLATFVKMLQQWSMDLGFSIPQSTVWQKLIALALDEKSTSSLNIIPTLLGERNQPYQNASVTNIDLSNLGLGQVFRALCVGLIENLHNILPKQLLLDANIGRIVGNGSGLSRNKVLQNIIQEKYKLPLEFTSGGDAAFGAAMVMFYEY